MTLPGSCGHLRLSCVPAHPPGISPGLPPRLIASSLTWRAPRHSLGAGLGCTANTVGHLMSWRSSHSISLPPTELPSCAWLSGGGCTALPAHADTVPRGAGTGWHSKPSEQGEVFPQTRVLLRGRRSRPSPAGPVLRTQALLASPLNSSSTSWT